MGRQGMPDFADIAERMQDEDEDAGWRMLLIFRHLYVDYYLWQLSRTNLRKKDLANGGPARIPLINRLRLLGSKGVFDGKPELVHNIELLDEIYELLVRDIALRRATLDKIDVAVRKMDEVQEVDPDEEGTSQLDEGPPWDRRFQTYWRYGRLSFDTIFELHRMTYGDSAQQDTVRSDR